MNKKWWIAIVVVVVVALGLYFGPKIYANVFAEDDAPAASVSTSGVAAASGDIDGNFTVVPGDATNTTAAGYTVAEVLNGSDVTVVGSTSDVSGTATVEDEQLTAGEIVVQTATITTDSDRRDNQFRGNIFDVAANPTATFTVSSPVDLSSLPQDGTAGEVSVDGTLSLKGVTQDVTVPMQVVQSGEDLIASGSIDTTWADYGVEPPSLGFVTVSPSGSVDFLVTLARG